MPDEEESELVDLDQLERIFWWAAGVCWAIVAVIVLGEFQGWWNDLGEVSGTIATVIGGLLTIIALLINATKSQARAVRMGVTDNGRRLGLIHDGVMDNGRRLGLIHDGVMDNGRRLGLIHDGVMDNGRRLGLIHDGVMDNGRRLGLIHEAVETLHLDNQHLRRGNEQLHEDNERQTEVLIEIRDRL